MEKGYHFNAWCSIDLPIETVIEDDGSVFHCGGNYPETIQGERFCHFLDMCFEEATSFSLQKGLWPNHKNESLEKELESYEIRNIRTLKWFGWDLTTAPEEDAWVMCQKMYRATENTKAILKKHFDEVFLGHANNKMEVTKYTLEDLCFFKENKLFVGSVSHEFILYVFPPSEEFERKMNKLGIWENASENIKEITLDSFG